MDPPQAIGKRKKTVASGSAHVVFDGVALPPKTTANHQPGQQENSTRVAKATTKKETTSALFLRLGQEFGALAKTCEELGEALE